MKTLLVEPDLERRDARFPLNDMQQAYWMGRSTAFDLGGVATHFYTEIEGRIELDRFRAVWNRLVRRHDALRTVIFESGEQQILKDVPDYEIKELDLRHVSAEELESRLETMRSELSHQIFQVDQWPLFEVRASRIPDGKVRIHISVDGLLLDGWSYHILFEELNLLYRDPAHVLSPLKLSCRDYILAELDSRNSAGRELAKAYWDRRVADLPDAPALPLAHAADANAPKFSRFSAHLGAEPWRRLKARAAQESITPTGLLLAAYAEVLSVWGRDRHFTINVPSLNRLPLHPEVNAILGVFVTFGLLEVDNRTPGTFLERAARIQERIWDDLEHSLLSGVEILRDFRRRRNDPHALMPIVFTSVPREVEKRIISKAELSPDFESIPYTITQTSQVWLDCQVVDDASGLTTFWDYVEDVFPEGMVRDAFDAYVGLLHKLASDESFWTRDLASLVPIKQLRQREWINHTDVRIPDVLLHDLVRARGELRPDDTAVIAADRTLSYAELLEMAEQLAAALRGHGAEAQRPIPVLLHKGWEQVVAVLAILAVPAPFVPIDPSLPGERIDALLSDLSPSLVVTHSLAEKHWRHPVAAVQIDAPRSTGPAPAYPGQKSSDLAYIIYTSGSTGKPKGVMVSHQSAVNFVLDAQWRFDLGSSDRVAAITALEHDLSIFDLFATLVAGGTIVMPDPLRSKDPAHWARLVQDHRVTVWNSVPVLCELLVDRLTQGEAEPSLHLRSVILGGDFVPPSLPDRLFALGVKDVTTIGGPTETTIWNITFPVLATVAHRRSIPYGKPISNSRCFVLDAHGQDCPTWVSGEIYASGACLANGYWGDPELTRLKFTHHEKRGRVYATGDRGRYLPDGNIEIMGRLDQQLKVAGHRIEPAEVEAVLSERSDVLKCVITKGSDFAGRPVLVAYVVPLEMEGASAGVLMEYLQGKVPLYMVPARIEFVTALPMTSNGKVDRSRVASQAGRPVAAAPENVASVSSSSETLDEVSSVIREVLRVQEVDPDAFLFQLGASSIDVIRIANVLEKRLHFRPPLDELIRLSSARKIAEVYDQARSAKPGVDPTAKPVASVSTTADHPEVILNPDDRRSFKQARASKRKALKDSQKFPLPSVSVADVKIGSLSKRQSQRRFSGDAISLRQFGEFLSCLQQAEAASDGKRSWGSAGGLYPVDIYVSVKSGRIDSLPAGTFFYDGTAHELVAITPGVEIGAEVHAFVNQQTFQESACSLYLVLDHEVIVPLYGESSRDFGLIEAGEITQLLDLVSRDHGLGLCQIGNFNHSAVRDLFQFAPQQLILHSVVVGPLPRLNPALPVTGEEKWVYGVV